MTQRLQKTILFAGVILTLLVSILSGIRAGSASPARLNSRTVFLPVVRKDSPRSTIFGMDLTSLPSAKLPLVVNAGVSWVRITSSWAKVEPTPGSRDWGAVAAIEQQILDAVSNHLTPILIIEDTPTWALKTGFHCGAVAQEQFPALQAFLTDMVKRYAASPYNVRYWEMWNEPDVAEKLGCWGTPNEPYYGGEHYGEMLKIAYPAIKAVQPSAQVLVGGLLLDCDPRNPPQGKDCTSSTFLTGALQSGAANSFDGVSFHAYDYYAPSDGMYRNSNWNSAWNTTGPVHAVKADYLTSLLNEANVSKKYLINTEFALLCDNCSGVANYENLKAAYLAQGYIVALAKGYAGNLWYSMMGWRSSGLLNSNLEPLPAYYAFRFARQQLGEAQYVQKLSLDGLDGYEFKRNTTTIWVLWAKDLQTHPISLPETPDAIFDISGNAQPIDGVNLSVAAAPWYVVWTP